ncbi:MAG: cobalamin biosynthesis protein, partial [Candidatus Methanomethylophilaceae archaeon]|nr:cobalamin biosynthesis protein [Candidatus Methanomethylophilaceae archaeon]
MALEGRFSSSGFVKSVTAVDCVCERSAMRVRGGQLIRRKTAYDGMTVALCKTDMDLRF